MKKLILLIVFLLCASNALARIANRTNNGAIEGTTTALTSFSDFYLYGGTTSVFDEFTDVNGDVGLHIKYEGVNLFWGTDSIFPVEDGKIYEITARVENITGGNFPLTVVNEVSFSSITYETTGYDGESGNLEGGTANGPFRMFYAATHTGYVALRGVNLTESRPWEMKLSGIRFKEIIPVEVSNTLSVTLAVWGSSSSVYPAAFYRNYVEYANVYNGAVGGYTSTQIKDNFLSHPEYFDDPIIVLSGNNDTGAPQTIIDNVATMVSNLTHSNYLIIRPWSQGCTTGTTCRTNIETVGTAFQAAYGDNYFNAEDYLRSLYPDDPNYSLGILPEALMSADGVHLSLDGYMVMVNYIVANYPALFEHLPTSDVSAIGIFGTGFNLIQ